MMVTSHKIAGYFRVTVSELVTGKVQTAGKAIIVNTNNPLEEESDDVL